MRTASCCVRYPVVADGMAQVTEEVLARAIAEQETRVRRIRARLGRAESLRTQLRRCVRGRVPASHAPVTCHLWHVLHRVACITSCWVSALVYRVWDDAGSCEEALVRRLSSWCCGTAASHPARVLLWHGGIDTCRSAWTIRLPTSRAMPRYGAWLRPPHLTRLHTPILGSAPSLRPRHMVCLSPTHCTAHRA